MKAITLLDLFSGTGGFPLGLLKAGFTLKKHYFSEIDPFAIANYQYNFKNASYAGPIEEIQKNTVEKPDVISFGSPCQDLSVAGRRKGLKGSKSKLFFEAIRILDLYKPRLFIFENVKGLSPVTRVKTLKSYLDRLPTLGYMTSNGNCLILPGFSPRTESESTLSDHLEDNPDQKYFLSVKTAKRLKIALEKQSRKPTLLRQ